jgi:SAM-dependent methyltransferase
MPAEPHYRWNTSDFALGYDAAADVIHPQYLAIQDEILNLLPLRPDKPAIIVDLGGGSGRLMERVLSRWPLAQGIVLDQSEPFLAIAERRLARFGERARCILMKFQAPWPADVPQQVNAFVSMSAIHHLEPAEKESLYRRCADRLAPGGVLLNGDEVRAADEGGYRASLEQWAEHMRRQMTAGTIPALFHSALHGWIERNVTRFGEPKRSGDDCHETIEAQLEYLRSGGFPTADCPWRHDLWAILRARMA